MCDVRFNSDHSIKNGILTLSTGYCSLFLPKIDDRLEGKKRNSTQLYIFLRRLGFATSY